MPSTVQSPMLPAIGLIAIGGFAASVPAGAQTQFTGTITYRATSPEGAPAAVVQAQRGNAIRLEVRTASTADTGGGVLMYDRTRGALIYDRAQDVAYVLFPTDRTSVRLTQADMQTMAHDMERRMAARHPESTHSGTLAVRQTGRTRTVAGERCTVYRVTGTERGRPIVDDACIADGLGLSPYDLPQNGLLVGHIAQEGWLAVMREALQGNRGLLELTRARGGQPSIELVATRIDRSAPADSLFVPPAGYRALTLQEALGEELHHR